MAGVRKAIWITRAVTTRNRCDFTFNLAGASHPSAGTLKFWLRDSFTADFFGAKSMGGLDGIILLAWGLAAIPSPIVIAHIY